MRIETISPEIIGRESVTEIADNVFLHQERGSIIILDGSEAIEISTADDSGRVLRQDIAQIIETA